LISGTGPAGLPGSNFYPGFGGGFGGGVPGFPNPPFRTGTLSLLAVVMWASGALGIIAGSLALLPILIPTYTLPTVNLILLITMGVTPIIIGVIEIIVGILVFTQNLSAYTPTIAVEALSLVTGFLVIISALLFAFVYPPLGTITSDFQTLVAITASIIYGIFTIFVSILSFIVMNSRTARIIFNRARPRDFGIQAGQFGPGFPGQFGPFPGQFGPPFGGPLPGQFPYYDPRYY